MDLQLVNTICNIATPFVMVGGFLLLKFNDLSHLEKDVTEMKIDIKENFATVIKTQSSQSKKINNIDKKVAVLTEKTDTLEKTVKK